MEKTCIHCGEPLVEGSKFCSGCGAPVTIPAINETTEKDIVPGSGSEPEKVAVSDPKDGVWNSFLKEIKDLIRHPKKLIPTFVISGVWILFSVLSSVGVNLPVFRFLYTLTYANGGMFGGFFGAVGGIFGKAVFAAVINILVLDLCAKKNPFKGLKNGFGGIFKGGLAAVMPFIIGSGIGLTIYCFFNITSSPVNCAVAVAGAVGTVSAATKKNGLLFSAVFTLLKKGTKGKAPSQTAVTRILAGFSAGFALGLPLTFIRMAWLTLVIGLLMILVPIVLMLILNKKTPGNKSASVIASVLLLTILFSAALPVFAVTYDDSYCERTFKGETLWSSELSPNSLFGRQYDSENGIYRYDWVHQLWDEDHEQLYYQEKYDLTIRMKAILENQGEWLDSMTIGIRVADYTTDFLEPFYQTVDDIKVPDGYSKMNIKVDGYDAVYVYTESKKEGNGNGISSWAENKGTVYVPIVDAPNQNGKINTVLIRCSLSGESFALFDSMIGDYLDRIRNLPCSIELKKQVQEFKKVKDGDKKTEESDPDEESDLKPFRGRLTYTNGKKNKYGQPFPDLMDFDGDGEITWLDVDIQRELSHDPDWLDRPTSKTVGILLAVLTGLLGAGGGAVGGILGGTAGTIFSGTAGAAEEALTGIGERKTESQEEDLGPYIHRDPEGDLNVKDPATGEERLYVSNGDGTYTNPLTGATYTEQELKDSLDSRAENAGLIRQDTAAAETAVKEQREQAKDLSEFSKGLEKEAAEEREKAEKEQAHDVFVEKMKFKYDETDENAVREKIGEEQAKAEIEGYEQLEYEKAYAESQKYTENVKKGADIAIDVLAEIEPTQAGKAIKDAYTVGTAAAGNFGEVVAGDKTVAGALAQTAVESTVGLVKNHAGDIDVTGTAGYAEKAVANIVGDGTAAVTNALVKGESLEKAREEGSNAAMQGGANFIVDSVFDGLGAKFGSESGETAARILGENISKEAVTEGSKALGSDIVKDLISPEDS